MPESSLSNLAYSRPIASGLVGGLSILRQESLNLVYLIKETILPLNGYVSKFTETVTPSTQTTDPDTGLTVTPYKSTFYDWTYYNPDPSNPALTGLLTTPTLSTSGSLAYVDYGNGTVYYSGIQTQSITMTYNFYTVSVQDGFPDFGEDRRKWEDIRIPLVSIDFLNRRNRPIALGGPYEEDRTFVINILGMSDPQRNDIADTIEQALRYDFPNTIDFSYGFPVNFNGDKNLNFDRGPATRWKNIRFQETSSRAIRTPDTMPEKFRHQTSLIVTVRLN